MARRYEGLPDSGPTDPAAPRRLDHSTARAFAAALSALAISSLVVSTTARALHPDGEIGSDTLRGGTVSVSDDDGRLGVAGNEDAVGLGVATDLGRPDPAG